MKYKLNLDKFWSLSSLRNLLYESSNGIMFGACSQGKLAYAIGENSPNIKEGILYDLRLILGNGDWSLGNEILCKKVVRINNNGEFEKADRAILNLAIDCGLIELESDLKLEGTLHEVTV